VLQLLASDRLVGVHSHALPLGVAPHNTFAARSVAAIIGLKWTLGTDFFGRLLRRPRAIG
jgi:hypothetical protein